MKDSFILYTSYMTQLELLTMEQRGALLTAIMAYASGADLPEMDGAAAMAFAFIKADMDRNAERYDKVIEARREAGKHGGRPKANGFSESKEKQTEAKKAEYVYEYDDELKEKTPKGVQKKSGFTPPTPQQVREYCEEKGYTNVDAEKCCDFYESKGWFVGKTKMKDWKAAVRNWSRSQRQEKTADGRQGKTVNRFNNFEQREYDWTDLERRILAAQEVH